MKKVRERKITDVTEVVENFLGRMHWLVSGSSIHHITPYSVSYYQGGSVSVSFAPSINGTESAKAARFYPTADLAGEAILKAEVEKKNKQRQSR